MQRTISVKLDVPDGFLDYLKTCSIVFNRHVDWCFAERSTNKVKAHHALYYPLREEFPQIPSSVLQGIRDAACEAVKAVKFKFKPSKKPHSAVRYNARTISLRGNLLTFSSSQGRIKQLIKLPDFFTRRYSSWKFQSATIGYHKQKGYVVANLVFIALTPLPISNISHDSIVGIDRGLYNIVSLSDGQNWSSQKIRKQKRQFLFVKRQLQAKGTRPATRKLKARSGREKRFSSDVNHVISKWLVSLPYDTFVLEDLSGIRTQHRGRKLNGWLSNWTFYQLEQYLEYKAEAEGKTIVKVDARYTSQKCSCCGNIDKKSRDGSRYCCVKCEHAEHADLNAAKNIKNNHILSLATDEFVEWKSEQALVNVPNALSAAPTMQCIDGIERASDASQRLSVVGD